MNPTIKRCQAPEERARWGIRGIDAFTAEELAQLQQKVEGWIRQRALHPSRRQRPMLFVGKPTLSSQPGAQRRRASSSSHPGGQQVQRGRSRSHRHRRRVADLGPSGPLAHADRATPWERDASSDVSV
jgi:hypothetical protein